MVLEASMAKVKMSRVCYQDNKTASIEVISPILKCGDSDGVGRHGTLLTLRKARWLVDSNIHAIGQRVGRLFSLFPDYVQIATCINATI